MERLLEGLEHRDAEFRFTNARRLLYVLQGLFSEAHSNTRLKLQFNRNFCGNIVS